MSLDFYDIKPIKTIYHFIMTRKGDNHKFKLKVIENPENMYEEPNVIIIVGFCSLREKIWKEAT